MGDSGSGGGAGSAARGTFPFSLSDQASLFNFHAPTELDVDALRMGADQTLAAERLVGLPGGDLAFAGPLAGGLANAAQAQQLGSALYGMGLDGIPPLDGLYASSGMVLPPGMEQQDSTAAISGPPGLQHMAASFGMFDPLNLLSGLALPLMSPASPLGSGQGAEQATAALPAMITGPQSTGHARVDQACKMCRRRKVRCDGKRPSCSFCQTKTFACVYEPATLGSHRRKRRAKGSDMGSAGFSSVARGASGGARRSSPPLSGTESDLERYSKQRRLSEMAGATESTSSSDAESDGAPSGDEGSRSGYLDALSNRQIALLDNVGTSAANASVGAGGAPVAPDDERCVRLYFENYHPQHPVLHRHTFEASVRDGTVNKPLWHAVLAIAARYGPAPTQQQPAVSGDGAADTAEPSSKPARRLRPCEYGWQHAETASAMLPAAMKVPSIEAIQTLYLLSEHHFGAGGWLAGSTYWGTAVRMFNQLQLHMTDEAFQFPAYTSHLGLHESAISPLTSQQSPANYAAEMRAPTLNNQSWIRRELVRRMRWVLFESERIHSLASGRPPLVTLEAGWVHMPCSDAIWELPEPRCAAEHERLLLHMGRYYVDTGGSLRIDMAQDADSLPGAPHGIADQQRAPNRVASMLVSVRRRKNRIHLNAHTAIVIGQMTRSRLALYRLFFPCRWPSQLMATDAPGAEADLGGGGGAAGPVVLSWEERFRRMRATIGDIEAKLAQWRVYLELMFSLREHEEGSGRTDDESSAIRCERIEYANYRFLLAALLIQNRSTVLQLQACLARRERKIRGADQEAGLGLAARQTLAHHVVPNQPDAQAMQTLRAYAQECWDAVVRQACEIADLLESHWQVRPHANPGLRVLIQPDWHAPNAIKAKINAESNLRRYPVDSATGQRAASAANADVFFSHETPPHPLLVVNCRLLDAVVRGPAATQRQPGAELALAASMNSNIHIETNANARDATTNRADPGASARAKRARRPRIPLTDAGEVDYGSADEADRPAADPFRRQLTGTAYFLFLAAKTLIMYIHQAKMSAYILARRNSDAAPAAGLGAGGASSDSGGDGILPSSSASVENGADSAHAQAMLGLDFAEDLSPAPQLRALADIRRMQDRLEVVMAALRA
ncbi:hypothetical protein IWQ56_002648, partial [Coemansia nantahalensis]